MKRHKINTTTQKQQYSILTLIIGCIKLPTELDIVTVRGRRRGFLVVVGAAFFLTAFFFGDFFLLEVLELDLALPPFFLGLILVFLGAACICLIKCGDRDKS